MGKNFTSAFVLCATIACLPLACGDDEDDGGGGGGKGGKGGSAGSTGGSAGAGARGGSAGAGATGGNAGRGGTAGQGGTGGRGGTAGSAGTTPGGMGGATDGGVGGEGGEGNTGNTAGMGGHGGVPEPPTLCEQVCDAASAANCSDMSTCEFDLCEWGYDLISPDCNDEYELYLQCLAAQPASGFSCQTDGKPGTDFATVCATEFGVWDTCNNNS